MGSVIDPCRGLEVDICMTHLTAFFKGGQCVVLNRADDCLRAYTRQCMTKVQQQLFNIAFNGIERVEQEYCKQGSVLQTSYREHVPCLRSVMRDPQNPCVKDLQVMAEAVTGAAWHKRINYACCAYHRVGACMAKQITRACGKKTTDFIKTMARKLASRLPDIRCREQKDQGSAVCRELPPFGSSPRGGNTTSVITKLIRVSFDSEQ